MPPPFILAIDQGTTSTRAILFDPQGTPVAIAQRELPQIYPAAGLVEHDAEEILAATVDVCRQVLAQHDVRGVAAIGITNQRETVVVWDRRTGVPLGNAIVWQDRRTAERCDQLAEHASELVRARTGLLLDPYFSATKIGWILEHVPGAAAAAEAGDLLCGTIDTFLLWRLSGGRVHATDATNASRTMLFDIHRQEWDDELLAMFDVPRSMLPEVRDCAADYGHTDASWFGVPIPIAAMAGDQQAAAFGQMCFADGSLKVTFGTGAFALLHTGDRALASRHRLLTTVACRLNGVTTYALEGSIFAAGATVQWLRDQLGFFADAGDCEDLALRAEQEHGVHLVPAFTGLGAPHWDPNARAAILGLTRASGRAEIASAALQAVGFSTSELLATMQADGATLPAVIRVDGGLARNDYAMQFLADIVGVPVERPVVTETTALGVAFLAGLHVGVFTSTEQLAATWRCDRRFRPSGSPAWRGWRQAAWRQAVARVLMR